MNHLLTLRYDGTAYHGWQRQENAVTVQEEIEKAVYRLFGERCTVTGCSRTDTGVHANCFKCNFHTEKEINNPNIISGLNHFLPEDIAVYDSRDVPENFNARFDCVSKEYIYKIYNGRFRDPFYNKRAFFYRFPLDGEFLNSQAKDYIGRYDFTSFRASGATVKTTERTVINAAVERYGDLVVFRVEADGFLYNMVRIMVGTLLSISEGKIEAGTIPQIIQSKNRLNAGITAQAYGLYLNDVRY